MGSRTAPYNQPTRACTTSVGVISITEWKVRGVLSFFFVVETPHPTLPSVRCISWNSVAVVCAVVRAPAIVREQGIEPHGTYFHTSTHTLTRLSPFTPYLLTYYKGAFLVWGVLMWGRSCTHTHGDMGVEENALWTCSRGKSRRVDHRRCSKRDGCRVFYAR